MSEKLAPRPPHNYLHLVKSKNTSIEKVVFKYLRKNNIYFQKHHSSKIGVKIDIALPRKKKAVFIDGDFWHGRTVERVKARRGENDFWTMKLMRNIERDKEQGKMLSANGWRFIRVWESELTKKSSQQDALERIKNFLTSD